MYYISAKILLIAMAVLVLVMIIPAFLAPKTFKDVVMRMTKNSDLMRLAALRILVLGFVYVSNYSKIDATWNSVVSITGRAMILKGIVGLRYPGYAAWKAKTFRGTKSRTYSIAVLCAAMGIFYIWVACAKF